jgi:hypothetical protein
MAAHSISSTTRLDERLFSLGSVAQGFSRLGVALGFLVASSLFVSAWFPTQPYSFLLIALSACSGTIVGKLYFHWPGRNARGNL